MTKQFTEEENKKWRAARPKKLVDVKIIIRSTSGNILLVKPDYKLTWQFPGGGVDEGESPAQAAARELHEETGIKTDEAKLKIIDTVFKEGEDHLFLIYEMQVQLDETQPLHPLDPEIKAYKFVEPGQVTGLIPSYYASFWDKFSAL
jgi:8-oxo-dGTP pyrophosphatase MutT (NUDIX family)